MFQPLKRLNAAGSDNVKTFAEGLGFDFGDDPLYEASAIGGVEYGFSPLLMAAAYASLEMAEFIMNLLPLKKL